MATLAHIYDNENRLKYTSLVSISSLDVNQEEFINEIV